MTKKSIVLSASVMGWLFIGILIGQTVNPDQSGTPGSATALHRRILTLDSHVDTPIGMANRDMGIRNPTGVKASGDLDIPRMDEGGLDAVFFAVFVKQSDRSFVGLTRARFKADSILTSVKQMVKRYPNKLELALNPKDARRIAASGKHAIYLGMENGYPLGREFSSIAHFYNQGVRYVTLCHARNNDLCDSATDTSGPEFAGLSWLGRDAVREMNRLGMMVDLSHASDAAFFDAVKTSKAPVILSHSSCRTLCRVPRNASDEMLKALAKNGGVIQINLYTAYLRREIPADSVTVRDVADHIDHAVKIAGIDHVGIGTDFDGWITPPRDVRDVSEIPHITAELMRRGFSETDIAKIWGGNFLRVFEEVQKIAKATE